MSEVVPIDPGSWMPYPQPAQTIIGPAKTYTPPRGFALQSGDRTLTVLAASSVKVLDVNPRRWAVWLVNDGATSIYLALSTGPAAVNKGVRLNAGGGALELNLTNMWRGEIWAIAETSNSNMVVTEVTA